MKLGALPPVNFDPQRRAASSALKTAIQNLTACLEQSEADLKLRQRARKQSDRDKYRLAVEVIAVNLAVVSMFETDRLLAVPRSSARYVGDGPLRQSSLWPAFPRRAGPHG